MDQDEHGGHPLITREAVRQLFEARGFDEVGDGVPRVDGLTQDEYAQRLNQAQKDQDVVAEWPTEIPTYGTSVPAKWDGDVQREHAMADPDLSGEANLARNRDYVQSELHNAHEGGADEFRHLGNAAHALEDSYSGAHAWRNRDALAAGDPTAPVESINVWDPTPGWNGGPTGKFLSDEQGTHDERFDHVEVHDGQLAYGGDQAAANATAQMLIAHVDAKSMNDVDAREHVNTTTDQFFEGAADGVEVNHEATPEWRAERDERLDEMLGREHEKNTVEQVREFYDDAAQTVSNTYDVVAETVSDTYDAAAQGLSDTYDAAAEAVSDTYDAAAETFTDMYDAAAETVSDTYDAAAQGLSDTYDATAETVSDTYDAAAETVGDTYDAVAETVSNTYDAAAETVTDMYDSAAETVSDMYDSAAETVSDMYDSAAETVSDTYDAAADTVSDTYDVVAETVTDTYDAAAETVSDTYDAAAETVSDTYDAAADSVSDAYDAVGDAWDQLTE